MCIGNVKDMSTSELYKIRRMVNEEIELREKEKENNELEDRKRFLGDNTYGNDQCATPWCRLTCCGCDDR